MDRDTASELYSGAASYSKEITFTDLRIEEVAVDDKHADIRFRVDCIVDLRSRRPIDGILHVDSQWTRTDGDWLLSGFSWSEGPR